MIVKYVHPKGKQVLNQNVHVKMANMMPKDNALNVVTNVKHVKPHLQSVKYVQKIEKEIQTVLVLQDTTTLKLPSVTNV